MVHQRSKYLHLDIYNTPRESYSYYSTPDGEDLFKKLAYTIKYFGGIGLVAGVMKGLHKDVPFHLFPFETLRVAVPWAAAAALYTVTTYSATKLRKKDDITNAMIGGAAAGLVFASMVKIPFNKGVVFLGSVALCGLKKKFLWDGYDFPPKPMAQTVKSAWALRNTDWSLQRDIKGGWTTEPRKPRVKPSPPPPPPIPKTGVCADFS